MAMKNSTAFTLLHNRTITSLNVDASVYQHQPTKALHVHLASNNPENVFMVALRTVPTDSTGVAHILEHSSLCGSERFPVRDPFFMMTRRSLNTFMNAFTSSDWTAYPFASQNRKDFANLMDVYLDAVFFSRLHELDFAQEGHRLEYETADDPTSDLVFKGVVFNEMKGAMSSPMSTLYDSLNHYLFPTNTYHFNSGGDPEEIPNLSYTDLKAFYDKHYHPGNAVFLTYGNIPVVEHHAQFDTMVLQRFGALSERIRVPKEKRYHAPIRVEEAYAIDTDRPVEKQTHHILGWLLGPITDLDQRLQAQLLSNVLLGNSASPLRKALETFPHASAPSPLCGLEDTNYEMSFICGVEGSDAEHASKFETLVIDTLEQIANNGVPQEMVQAVLHQLEISQREVGGDSYPYGLQLLLQALPACIHDADPLTMLDVDPPLAKLREVIKDPQFIPTLTRDLLLNNRHRVRLTLRPDTELNRFKHQAEIDKLTTIKASLSPTQQQQIIQQAQDLQQRQNQVDDESVLPKVTLTDVPKNIEYPQPYTDPVAISQANWPLIQFRQGTNGLIYQQLVIDLPKLDSELLDLLPLYAGCLAELGAGEKDYLQMQTWQSKISGGVNASYRIRGGINDVNHIKGHFCLSSKALNRNHEALAELMQTTLENARFDELVRLRELIAQERAQREESVTGQGHSLAMAAAGAGTSKPAELDHRLSGLESIRYLKRLDDSLNESDNIAKLAEQFKQIHQAILAAPRQLLQIGEGEQLPLFQQQLQTQWQTYSTQAERINNNGFTAFDINPPNSTVQNVWLTATQVNFCAKAFTTVPPNHPDTAALSVLASYLRNGYLHRVIREQGGAYGGGASHDVGNGVFNFYSYRDPRFKETLADFDAAVAWLMQEKSDPAQLEQAILGLVSGLDKPSSPAGEASLVFHNQLYGRTENFRRQYRQQVLDVSFADLQQVAQTYLTSNPHTAVVSQTSTWQTLKDELSLNVEQL